MLKLKNKIPVIASTCFILLVMSLPLLYLYKKVSYFDVTIEDIVKTKPSDKLFHFNSDIYRSILESNRAFWLNNTKTQPHHGKMLVVRQADAIMYGKHKMISTLDKQFGGFLKTTSIEAALVFLKSANIKYILVPSYPDMIVDVSFISQIIGNPKYTTLVHDISGSKLYKINFNHEESPKLVRFGSLQNISLSRVMPFKYNNTFLSIDLKRRPKTFSVISPKFQLLNTQFSTEKIPTFNDANNNITYPKQYYIKFISQTPSRVSLYYTSHGDIPIPICDKITTKENQLVECQFQAPNDIKSFKLALKKHPYQQNIISNLEIFHSGNNIDHKKTHINNIKSAGWQHFSSANLEYAFIENNEASSSITLTQLYNHQFAIASAPILKATQMKSLENSTVSFAVKNNAYMEVVLIATVPNHVYDSDDIKPNFSLIHALDKKIKVLAYKRLDLIPPTDNFKSYSVIINEAILTRLLSKLKLVIENKDINLDDISFRLVFSQPKRQDKNYKGRAQASIRDIKITQTDTASNKVTLVYKDTFSNKQFFLPHSKKA